MSNDSRLNYLKNLKIAQSTPQVEPKISEEIQEIIKKLHHTLVEQIDLSRISELSRPELKYQLENAIEILLKKWEIDLGYVVKNQVNTAVLNEIVGYGPLEELMNDSTVTEIWVHGHQTVFIRRTGEWESSQVCFFDVEHLLSNINRMFAKVGKRLDETTPSDQIRWSDGTVIHAVIPPLSPNGPMLMIRRPSQREFTLNFMLEQGVLTREMALFLMGAVRDKRTMVVAGLRGPGRTTLLNVLTGFIPEDQRVALLETQSELRLNRPNTFRLNPKGSNVLGVGSVSMASLIPTALGFSPDRLVLDECRGPEASGLLDAIQQGYYGCLFTLAAKSPDAAWRCWEMFAMQAGNDTPRQAVREAIISVEPIFVQAEKWATGKFRVSQICELNASEQSEVQLQKIF